MSDGMLHPRAPLSPRDHADDSDGSVKKLKSGRFRAQWPRRIDPLERNINPDGSTYTNETEARLALRDAVSDHRRFPEQFLFVVPGAANGSAATVRTVALATQDFIDTNADELAVKTVREYRSIRRVVVCHPEHGLGDKVVKELTPGALATWRTRTLPDAGVTPAQAAHGWRFLRSVLSWEVENDNLVQNPALGQTQRRRKKNTSRNVRPSNVPVPTWQQEMDLSLAVEDEARRLLMLVLMRCGPRFGEAAAIDPDVLDPRRNVIPLTHQWVRAEAGLWVKEPLKAGYERDMHVPPQLMEGLVDFRDKRWEEPAPGRKRVLFPHIGLSGLSRARKGVGVWTAAEYRRVVLLTARDSAGIPKVRIKDLRMSAASNFHEAGFSDVTVQELIGHQPGSGVTRRHYVRPQTDAHSEVRSAISSTNSLSTEQRLSALWEAWLDSCGDPLKPWRRRRARRK